MADTRHQRSNGDTGMSASMVRFEGGGARVDQRMKWGTNTPQRASANPPHLLTTAGHPGHVHHSSTGGISTGQSPAVANEPLVPSVDMMGVPTWSGGTTVLAPETAPHGPNHTPVQPSLLLHTSPGAYEGSVASYETHLSPHYTHNIRHRHTASTSFVELLEPLLGRDDKPPPIPLPLPVRYPDPVDIGILSEPEARYFFSQ